MNQAITIILVLLGNLVGSQFAYATLVDPTPPPPNIHGETIMSPSSFVLNGVIIAPNRKIAIINGIYKKIGDQILGEDITAINQNTVQLKGPSGKITLFLFGK